MKQYTYFERSEKMNNKGIKDLNSYLNLIRRTVIGNSFLLQYFIKIVVVYMLANNVITWVAVSIPVVLEFSKMLSRGFKKIINIAINTNYKKYHLIYLLVMSLIFIIISQSHNIIIIYLFTIILGFISGINDSCVTRINTSNKQYESYCLIEEERSSVIGATLGLIISQILYDFNPLIYVLGFVIFGLGIFILNSNIPNIESTYDCMTSINDDNPLSKSEKKKIYIVTILYGIGVGAWCMGLSAFNELIPLITTKVGYLNAIYTVIEIIAFFIINAKMINWFKNSGKLLFWETICAICDISYLLIVAIFPNEMSIAIVMFLCGISSTIGDPVWGALISSYSENDRRKYALINNVYFIVRAISSLISIFVCRYFVIKGIYSFKYLAIGLFIFIIIMYLIANKINKKIFKKSI